MTKLTEHDVALVRSLCDVRRALDDEIECLREKRAAVSVRTLAEKFDVSEQTIKCVDSGYRRGPRVSDDETRVRVRSNKRRYAEARA